MAGPTLPAITPAAPGSPVASAAFTQQVSGLAAFQLGGPLAVFRQLTAQSVPSSAWTALTWDTIDKDTHGSWSSANPTRYTAAVPGWYEIDARVDHAYINATEFRSLAFEINGQNSNSARVAKVQMPPVIGVDTALTTSTCLYLNTADYVEAIVYNFSGSTEVIAQADGVTIMTLRWCHQ
jgi:hypothetical protein